MLFLLNTLCTNTDYTQNKARIINHTMYIADCFQPKQKEVLHYDYDLTSYII